MSRFEDTVVAGLGLLVGFGAIFVGLTMGFPS